MITEPPSIDINIDGYRNGYRDIKRRGGKIRLRISAPLPGDTPVKALATFSPLQKRLNTHILLSTAIDNEKMILIDNNRKILIHFFLHF